MLIKSLKLIGYFNCGGKQCRFTNFNALKEKSPKDWFPWTQNQ